MRVQINTYNSSRGLGEFEVEAAPDSLTQAIHDRNLNRATELSLITDQGEVSIVVPWHEVCLIMPLKEVKNGDTNN